MIKSYIVIDTNVFISAIIGQAGFPRKIFDEIILTNDVKICLSEEVLSEYEEVSSRGRLAKINGFTERAKNLITAIKEIAVWFEPKEDLHVLPDEDDNMFLELAVEANASYVVSGNTNDFIIDQFRSILIRTPKAFYEEWMLQSED